MKIALCFVMSMALCAAAHAAKPSGKVPLDLHASRQSVAEQISKIQRDMEDGETYSEITVDRRSEVRGALGRISGALDRLGPDGGLSPIAEAEAFNDQELINMILTQAKEDSRLVCRRERATGSNRLTSNCMTVAERRRLMEGGQKAMMDMSRSQQYIPPTGPSGL